jgi:hypothetical protein
VAAGLDEPTRAGFRRLLDLHLRYRFDSNGLDANHRRALRDGARLIAEALPQYPSIGKIRVGVDR